MIVLAAWRWRTVVAAGQRRCTVGAGCHAHVGGRPHDAVGGVSRLLLKAGALDARRRRHLCHADRADVARRFAATGVQGPPPGEVEVSISIITVSMHWQAGWCESVRCDFAGHVPECGAAPADGVIAAVHGQDRCRRVTKAGDAADRTWHRAGVSSKKYRRNALA